MTSNGDGEVHITIGNVPCTDENGDDGAQVTPCDRCKELEEELERRKREHTFYTALKKKITLTDTLIKKYNSKSQEFEQQRKKLEDVSFRLASSRRDCKVLEEQLAVTLKEVIPWKRGKDKFLKELEECRARLRETQVKLEGSEASCVQFKDGFFEVQEKLKTMEDSQADLKRVAEKSKQAEKKISDLNVKIKNDLTECKRDLKNTKSREARIVGKYKCAKNKIKELVKLLRNRGTTSSQILFLHGGAVGQDGSSPEDTDLDLPEDALSPPDNTPSPVRPGHPGRNLKPAEQKANAPTPEDTRLQQIFAKLACVMPVCVSLLPPSPHPASLDQDLEMSDTSSDLSGDEGSDDEAFLDVADQIESQLNQAEEEGAAKESPKKVEEERMQLRQTPQRKAKAQKKLEEAKDLHDDSDEGSSPEQGFSRRQPRLRAKKAKTGVVTPNRKSKVALESLSDSGSELDSALKEGSPHAKSAETELNKTKSPRNTYKLENSSDREINSKTSDVNGKEKERSLSEIKLPGFSGTMPENSDNSTDETSSFSKDQISCGVKLPTKIVPSGCEFQKSRDKDKYETKDKSLLSPDRRITRSHLKTLIEQGGTASTEILSLDANLEAPTIERNSKEKPLDHDRVQKKEVADFSDPAKPVKEKLKVEEKHSSPRTSVTRSASQSDSSSSQEMTPTPKRFLRSNSSPGGGVSCRRPSHELSSDALGKEGLKSPALSSPKKLPNSESLLEQSSGLDTGKAQTDINSSKPNAISCEEMSPRKLFRSVSVPLNKPGEDGNLDNSDNRFDIGSSRRTTRSQTLALASPIKNDTLRRVTRSLSQNSDLEVLPQKTNIVTSRKSRHRLNRSPNRTKEGKAEPKVTAQSTPHEQLAATFVEVSKKDALLDWQTADGEPNLKSENQHQSTLSSSCGTSIPEDDTNTQEGHPDEKKPSDVRNLQSTSEMEIDRGQYKDSSNDPLMSSGPSTERRCHEKQSFPESCKVETLPDHQNAPNGSDVKVSADTRVDVSIKKEKMMNLPAQDAAYALGEDCAWQEPTNEVQANLNLKESEDPVLGQLENGGDTKMQQVFINLPESPTGCKNNSKAEKTNIENEEPKTNTLSFEEGFSTLADHQSYVLADQEKCDYNEQDSNGSVLNKEEHPFPVCDEESAPGKEDASNSVENSDQNVGDHLSGASRLAGVAAAKSGNDCEEVVPQMEVSDRGSGSTSSENTQQHLKPCSLEVVQHIDGQGTCPKAAVQQLVTCMEAESSRASTPTTDETRSVNSMAGHISPVSPLSFQHSRPVSPLSSPSRSPLLSPLSPSPFMFDTLINLPRMVSPLPPSPEVSDFESVDEIRRPTSLEGLAASALISQPRMISPLFPTPVPPAVSPLPEAAVPTVLSPLSDTSPVRLGQPSVQDSPRNPLIPSPCNFHSEAPRDALSVRPQHSSFSGKQPASRCLASSFTTTNTTVSQNSNIISPRLHSLASEMASEFGESQPSTSKVKGQQSSKTTSTSISNEIDTGHPSTDSSNHAKREDGEKAGRHLIKHGLLNASKISSKTSNASWQTAFMQNLKMIRHSRITEGGDAENKETQRKDQQQVSVSPVNQKDHLPSVETRHKKKKNSTDEKRMPKVLGKRKKYEITGASSEDDALILGVTSQVEDITARRSTRSDRQDTRLEAQSEMTSSEREKSDVEQVSELASEVPRKKRKSIHHTRQTDISLEDLNHQPKQQLGAADGMIEKQGASTSDLKSPNRSKKPDQCFRIPALEIKTSGFKKPGLRRRQHEMSLKAGDLPLTQDSEPLVEENKKTAEEQQPRDEKLIRGSGSDASDNKVNVDTNVSDDKIPPKWEENSSSIKLSPERARLLTKTPDVKFDTLALKQPTLTLRPVSISSNQQITPLLEVKPQNTDDEGVVKPSRSKSNIGNIWGDIASQEEPGIVIFNRGKRTKKKKHNSGNSDNSQTRSLLTEVDAAFLYNSEFLKRRDDHKDDQTSLQISTNYDIGACQGTSKLPASTLHASSKPELLSPTSAAFCPDTLSKSASENNFSLTEQNTKPKQNLVAVGTRSSSCIATQSHVTAFSSETLSKQTSKSNFPQTELLKPKTKQEQQLSTPGCTTTTTPTAGPKDTAGRVALESLAKNLCTVETRATDKVASGPTVPPLIETDRESRKRHAFQQDDADVRSSPCKQPKLTIELPDALWSEVVPGSKVKSPVQKLQQPIFSDIERRLKELRSQTNVKPLIAAIMTYLGNEAINLMPAIQAKCLVQNTNAKPLLLPSEEQIIACILESSLPPKKSSMSMLLTCLCRGAKTPPVLAKIKPPIIPSTSYCRVFSALSRHLGFLHRVHVFCYDILHEGLPNAEELLLNIAVTWPDALMNKEGSSSPLCTAVEVVTMQRLVLAASPQNLQAQEIIRCFSVICRWRIPEGNFPTVQCHQLVMSMQDTNITRLQSTGTPTKILTPESFEVVKAVELLAYHQGWQWTNDHLVRDQLWPVLKKWSQEVQAASAASTTDPTSATTAGTIPRRQRKFDGSKPTGTGSHCVESPADASACAVMKVIGGVATIGLRSNKQSVFELLKMLAAVLQQPSSSVPWTVQVFTAEAILALSPSNPTVAMEVMQQWRHKATITIPRKLEDKVEVLARVANAMNTASK